MPALVPAGSREGYPPIEVAADQVEFWTGRGYVLVEGSPKPAKAAKAPKKRKK